MDKIDILIADDHKLIREGLKNFLNAHGEFTVVGEAETGEEAVNLTRELKPDMVVLDLNMPQMDGIQALREIKKSSPDTKIIVLTVFSQEDKVFPAIDAGADGYLLKDVAPEELISAINQVRNGQPALHPEIVQKLMSGFSSREDKRNKIKELTNRENEVLNLLARGKSNDEIAQALYISLPTVKTHVHNIFTKLNMTKRVQAALFAASQLDIFEEETGEKGPG